MARFAAVRRGPGVAGTGRVRFGMELEEMRMAYRRGTLERADLGDDPLAFLARWVEEAHEDGQLEPNAMALATASEEGRPSSRMVLLKGLDEHGLVFYTNHGSL